MFSPLDNKELDHWFRRLDAAWKRMPAEERTWQREEVQQHLEALAAAHQELGSMPEEAWSFALNQFGNPTKIGRKVYQEWRQSRTGFRAEMHAVWFGLGIQVAMWQAFWLLPCMGVPMLADYLLYLGATQVVLYVALGRRHPLHAIKGAFYTDILCVTLYLFGNILASIVHTDIPQLFILTFQDTFLLMMLSPLFLHLGIAYLASVTKRGWYRPTLDDFKLTLPTRRRQVG